MVFRSYHTHTKFCDGSNTVEQMVQAAIAARMHALGFSGHGTFPYDLRYCTKPEDFPAYVQEVNACKEKYAGQIEIYLGVEDDYYGVRPEFERDYTIGATHYIQKDGIYYYVDYSQEVLQKAIEEGFGADPYAFTKAFYQVVAQFPQRMKFDIVAHFDLVTKFNEGGRMFDESNPRYWKPALETMEYLAKMGYAFEINTGAISRGHRTTPYPSMQLLRHLYDFGGSIVFGCDSHAKETVCSYLTEAMELARECGFRTHRILTPNGWEDVPLDK